MANTDLDILDKLFRINWLLTHLHNTGSHGPHTDTNRGQGKVLALLKENPETSQAALAERLGIRQQSLTELLVKLEKKGFIEREHSDSDKRCQNVRLTEKGIEHEPRARDNDEIFGKWPDNEKAELGSYLDRIISTLNEKLGEGLEKNAFDWVKKTSPSCMGMNDGEPGPSG